MLYFHPLFQAFAILLGIYAFYLGQKRFRSRHFGQQTIFPWKRHVTCGLISLVLLISGMAGGMLMVYLYWNGFLMTGAHGEVALVLAPLVIFGIISGLIMNAEKKQRKALPLIHGINNVVVLCLALSQIFTGWNVLKTFVMGL